MRRFGPAWLALAVVLVSVWSLAQQPPPGVRLDYEADPRCSAVVLSPDTFITEVHARSARVRFAPDAPRSLVVRMVRERKGKLGGRIELREADGSTTERVVSGGTCEEVVSALGLVAALALDPLASTSPGTTSTSGTATATTATATATVTATATATATATGPDDGTERNLPLDQRTWSFTAGANAEAVFGVTPDPLFAVPVYFEAARALNPHVGLGGGLRFERAGETALTASVGADFTWTIGSLDLCVILRADRLRFDGCARVDAGTMEAHGEGVVPQRSATRPWVDVGGALGLRLRIAGPVYFEVAGQIGAAIVQDRFFLEPSTTVFQASALTGRVSGGVGFEIW